MFSTSVGLTKTVYNPAALKAAQKTSEEALKKKQVRGETDKGVIIRMQTNKICFLLTEGKFSIIFLTGSSEATAGCTKEETGNPGEAH